MTQSLTECPSCQFLGWEGEVMNCGAVSAEVRTNGSLPVLASWRCSNKHEWSSLIVVSKVEKGEEDGRITV